MELIKLPEQWDPISKQPMFKSGAVRILKVKNTEGNVKIHAREQQTAAIKGVESNKANAHNLLQPQDRKRYLEPWLANTYEAIIILLDLYNKRIPPLITDLEILAGLKKLSTITSHIEQSLNPYMYKFAISKSQHDHSISITLCDALFSTPGEGPAAYKLLLLLQGLEVYLSHLSGLLTVLLPASAAMWDGEFVGAVKFGMAQVERQLAWVRHEMKVKSPQTLVVPA
jgi:ferredoxin-nitrate reductase